MENKTIEIPQRLEQERQWIGWKYIMKGGKKTKVPFDLKTKEKARVNDPRSWTSGLWAKLAAGCEVYDGIGFVFTDHDPFVGIDIDHCIDPDTGEIDDMAAEIVSKCGTYAEVSPSGTGIHIIGLDPKRPSMGGRRKDGYEIYHTKRFFTFTGKALGPMELSDISLLVDYLIDTVMGGAMPIPEEETEETESMGPDLTASSMDDAAFLKALFNQKNGDVLMALYNGENPLFDGDVSRNDFYFCSNLNWRNQNDLEQTDRIFRGSKRMRDKWDERHFADGSTYGESTLKKSMAR